jgi:hypothetical protein
MAFYELLLLGSPTNAQRVAVTARIAEVAQEFSLDMPTELVVRHAGDADQRDRAAATAAIYFGGNSTVDLTLLEELAAAKIPIIPVTMTGHKIETEIPAVLHPTNGYFIDKADVQLSGLAAALLECVGLLHEQRRVFVSYRRNESREVAVQLHDMLSERGFDVFLDTHHIRPGSPFQEILFQRLADCDVVIMLDTADYFESRWTKQEIGRAHLKGIHILRLIWPDHTPSRHLNLADMVTLVSSDFDATKHLSQARVDEVARRTEALRSRSIATRHMSISGRLINEVRRMGGEFEGIGLHRSMALKLPHGKRIWAYPAVGIPTAQLLNDIHDKAMTASSTGFPILVYDHNGIGKAWEAHLAWLTEHIAAVKAVPLYNAAWELVEWDN